VSAPAVKAKRRRRGRAERRVAARGKGKGNSSPGRWAREVIRARLKGGRGAVSGRVRASRARVRGPERAFAGRGEVVIGPAGWLRGPCVGEVRQAERKKATWAGLG
jgi:hypothetical protein